MSNPYESLGFGDKHQFGPAANAETFRKRPLTVALEEVKEELFIQDFSLAECNVELSHKELIEWVFSAIRAPADRPNEMEAIKGFQHGLNILSLSFPMVKSLHAALGEVRPAEVGMVASATRQQRPLAGRKLAYMEYELCLAIGANHNSFPKAIAAVIVGELLLARLVGRNPDRRLLAKCRSAANPMTASQLTPPSTSQWKLQSQSACLVGIKEQITQFVNRHPKEASRFGMLNLDENKVAPIQDPDKEFDKRVKSRWMAMLAGMEEMSLRSHISRKSAPVLEIRKQDRRTVVDAKVAREWLMAKGKYIPVQVGRRTTDLDLSKTQFANIRELELVLKDRLGVIDDRSPGTRDSLQVVLQAHGLQELSALNLQDYGNAALMTAIAQLLDLAPNWLVLRAEEAKLKTETLSRAFHKYFSGRRQGLDCALLQVQTPHCGCSSSVCSRL